MIFRCGTKKIQIFQNISKYYFFPYFELVCSAPTPARCCTRAHVSAASCVRAPRPNRIPLPASTCRVPAPASRMFTRVHAPKEEPKNSRAPRSQRIHVIPFSFFLYSKKKQKFLHNDIYILFGFLA